MPRRVQFVSGPTLSNVDLAEPVVDRETVVEPRTPMLPRGRRSLSGSAPGARQMLFRATGTSGDENRRRRSGDSSCGSSRARERDIVRAARGGDSTRP